jgi:hypothetical protein
VYCYQLLGIIKLYFNSIEKYNDKGRYIFDGLTIHLYSLCTTYIAMSTPQNIFKQPPQVQRVHLGKVITPNADHDSPILEFGKRAAGQKRGLRAVASDTPQPMKVALEEELYERVNLAMAEVRKYGLAKEEGPYADKDGLVSEMAQALAPFVDNVADMGLLVFDILRPRIPGTFGAKVEATYRRTLEHPDYNFLIDDNRVPPLIVPTAGAILSNPEKRVDPISGATEQVVSHAFEVITLAVACLREIAAIKGMKVEIYPAFAISQSLEHEGEEEKCPVVVVMDQKGDVAMRTFGFSVTHPRVGSFDIMSDEAVLGFQHGLLAHNHVRNLGVKIDASFREGSRIDEAQITAVATEAGYHLAEFHSHWAGDMVQERMAGIEQTAAATFFVLNKALAEQKRQDLLVETAMHIRVGELTAAKVREKKSGVLGFLKSAELTVNEKMAIGKMVTDEFQNRSDNLPRLLALAEQQIGPEMSVAEAIMTNQVPGAVPDERAAFALMHSVFEGTQQNVQTFMGHVLASMAKRLTSLGINLAEEFEGEPANDG